MDSMNLSTEQIIDGLAPLIDEGRLTGRLMVDGLLIMDTGGDDVVDPADLKYDKYGYSIEQSVMGCVRNKLVDQRIRHWLAEGDEFEQAVATSTPQWLGLMIRDRNYTAEQTRVIAANNQAGFMFTGGLMVLPFTEFGDRYIHKDTGETTSVMTAEKRLSRKWRHNPGYRGAIIPNHRAIGWGNSVFPGSPNWEQCVVHDLPEALLERMDRLVAKARFDAQYPNADNPGVSPGG